MKSSKVSMVSPEQLALFDRLVSTLPEAVRKGVTVPYTSVNGNMYSYLHATNGLALRLPNGTRQEFIENFATKLFEAYGIVQKEYVAVPKELLEQTSVLEPYFKLSFEYAKTLRPKTVKSKKAV